MVLAPPCLLKARMLLLVIGALFFVACLFFGASVPLILVGCKSEFCSLVSEVATAAFVSIVFMFTILTPSAWKPATHYQAKPATSVCAPCCWGARWRCCPLGGMARTACRAPRTWQARLMMSRHDAAP